MKTTNKVFLGISLDGYISGKDGDLEWLEMIPNPNQSDLGYFAFMAGVDALLMGRTTYETVLGFDIDWPYEKPVFVLSNTLTSVPEKLEGKVILVKGELKDVLSSIQAKGYNSLYIDGGKIVQSFLKEDLVDEITLTQIPIILGCGVRLFDELPKSIKLELVKSEVLLDQIVQSHYKRK